MLLQTFAAQKGMSALFVALACGYSIPLHAAEGPSLAGPIGGTDIRSAVLPPPGLYGGGVALRGEVLDFVDGQGQPIPVLSDANIKRTIVAPFIGYVPNINVLGGSIGFGAIVPYGKSCGHLFQANPKLCQSGFGDPYLETQWSRFFGRETTELSWRAADHAGPFDRIRLWCGRAKRPIQFD
jgi:hypothetical protein